jgi:serine/threonine-protein kinase HipA
MRIIGELGIPVARTEIAMFGEQRALVIERFDRQWTKDGRLLRVPQEDCCQALSYPPTRKYQSDGGPSMVEMLEFLKGSDDTASDQFIFLKSQIAFWLLAAIDGHAKNFSVRLHPGGFELTPLYDVMSAQHLYDHGQIQRRQMRLAMAVGTSNNYQIHEILPRHYEQTADRAGVPQSAVTLAMGQIHDDIPEAIERACAALPSDFPAEIRDSITAGALARRAIIKKSLSV